MYCYFTLFLETLYYRWLLITYLLPIVEALYMFFRVIWKLWEKLTPFQRDIILLGAYSILLFLIVNELFSQLNLILTEIMFFLLKNLGLCTLNSVIVQTLNMIALAKLDFFLNWIFYELKVFCLEKCYFILIF